MLGIFLRDIFTTGDAVVTTTIQQFDADDLADAGAVLSDYYKLDIENMPHHMPAFNQPAAIWAAQYLYHSMQLLLLRQLGEEHIAKLLTDYTGKVSEDVVYSVDLTFRYLPDLLNAAKGLAPDDPFVQKLTHTANQWQYSSVGAQITALETESVIMESTALRTEYIDRIIEKKDKHRLKQTITRQVVTEALGVHSELIWPGFKDL